MSLVSGFLAGLRGNLCVLQAVTHIEICWLHEVNGRK